MHTRPKMYTLGPFLPLSPKRKNGRITPNTDNPTHTNSYLIYMMFNHSMQFSEVPIMSFNFLRYPLWYLIF